MRSILGYDDEDENVEFKKNLFIDFAFNPEKISEKLKYGVIERKGDIPVKLSCKKTSKNMFKSNDPFVKKKIDKVLFPILFLTLTDH
jgi:hypothetical protein